MKYKFKTECKLQIFIWTTNRIWYEISLYSYQLLMSRLAKSAARVTIYKTWEIYFRALLKDCKCGILERWHKSMARMLIYYSRFWFEVSSLCEIRDFLQSNVATLDWQDLKSLPANDILQQFDSRFKGISQANLIHDLTNYWILLGH